MKETQLTGYVLENFVWAELSKQATWSELYVSIYHYRTTSGLEVDIVLEDRMGHVVAIEEKNSTAVRPQDVKGLKHLQQELGDRFVKGIVLYTGETYIPLGDNIFALPVSSLWEYSKPNA